MSLNKNKRMLQLKFIASIFNMSLQEIRDTLGFETLTMIFRRVGEKAAENIVKRLTGKFTSIEEFCSLLVDDVFAPVIGEDMASYAIDNDKITFTLKACPYKKAGGYPIQDMSFFCHYTEGLIDHAVKTAFPSKSFFTEPVHLISQAGCEECVFDISLG